MPFPFRGRDTRRLAPRPVAALPSLETGESSHGSHISAQENLGLVLF